MSPEAKTSSRTTQVLKIMYILSWIAFIGLAIQAGVIIFAFVFGSIIPGSIETYKVSPDLTPLRQYDFWYYSIVMSLTSALAIIKAHVLYMTIQALSKVNMQNPFQSKVAQLIERISYTLLGGWVIVTIYNLFAEWLMKRTALSLDKWSGEEFFFMAGLVFIISQIFKRGVEIQSENDLTV